MGVVASILCAVNLLSIGLAHAGVTTPEVFAIGPQSLAGALAAFARQSQQEILFAPELMARKSSNGVRGTMSPLSALKVLLDGSGLSFTSTRNGAILIGTLASSTDSSANPVAGTPTELTEVIVSARREAEQARLAARIAAFVNGVTAFSPGDGAPGLAQWHAPVCPLVSGLPREKGELILAHISDIARAANVPLAGEHCRPNLYVYMTSRPKELLQGMEKRDFAFTFGVDALPLVVENFIGTPRTVRVWYHINREDDAAVTGNVFRGPLHYVFARIFVIVDQRRLGAASLGQVADYIGLVALAQVKQGARLDGAPTILSLFDRAQPAAPGSMSDWDRAYLKSLYETDVRTFHPFELRSKEQLEEIAQSMVKEINP
jgi:hypothetical protein